MSVCVVIVAYRTGPALSACLDALERASGVDEIVIVDNGSDALEAARIDAFASGDSRVAAVRGQGNIGFAAACNLAARKAQSDVIVFVNPDVVLESGAITQLTGALMAAPAPAIVGGDLRDAEGRPDRGSRRDRLTLWRATVSFSGLSRAERLIPALRDFNRHHDPLPPAPGPVGAVSGALLAAPRAPFLALGGFDEGYFLHVEDIDLCRRAEDAGWRVLFAPGPHGVHVRSTSAASPRDIARHKARGMARYFRKFARGPLERTLARLAGGLLILVAR